MQNASHTIILRSNKFSVFLYFCLVLHFSFQNDRKYRRHKMKGSLSHAVVPCPHESKLFYSAHKIILSHLRSRNPSILFDVRKLLFVPFRYITKASLWAFIFGWQTALINTSKRLKSRWCSFATCHSEYRDSFGILYRCWKLSEYAH